MQSLLESTTSSPKFAPSPSATPSRSIQVAAETDLIPDRTSRPSAPIPRGEKNSNKDPRRHSNTKKNHDVESEAHDTKHDDSPKRNKNSIGSPSVIIEPWGYNKNRNIPRWKAIKASIEKDMIKLRKKSSSHGNSGKNHRFTLVDYGSDQGFFSISAAHEFQKDGIFVVSVEMGGVGGEIWKKKDSINEGSNDVLSIQEQKVAKYVAASSSSLSEEKSASPFMICQTKISPKMFFDLEEHHQKHRYQFVLSVFHWFDLPTRKDFEMALVTLFKNSQSTFIELPTIGDRSALIRKQVGWTNFEKWYDGRSDIKEIILDAAKNEKFPVTVEKIVSVPWLKWTRDMYRVNWDLSKQQQHHDEEHDNEGSQAKISSPTLTFTCKTRREIYGCNPKREKLQECVNI